MNKRRKKRTRLRVLIATFVVLLAGSLAYIEFSLSRPVGSGPAGPSVDATQFDRPWSQRRVQVIGVGDSITAGLGAKSPSHTFFNRLITSPSDEHSDLKGVCLSAVLPGLQSHNFAISGSESATHLEVIQETIPHYDDEVFGIVLMTSGGNDLIHMYGRSPPRECAMYGATISQAKPWIVNFENRLSRMLTEIQSKFPGGCEIYLADIYDPTDGVGDAPSIFLPEWPDGLAIHSRYNQVIRNVAALNKNVFVVPLYDTFLGHGSHCRQFWRSTYQKDDPHYWFFTNIEDPNDRGYDAIRRVFMNTIVDNTSLLARRGASD